MAARSRVALERIHENDPGLDSCTVRAQRLSSMILPARSPVTGCSQPVCLNPRIALFKTTQWRGHRAEHWLNCPRSSDDMQSSREGSFIRSKPCQYQAAYNFCPPVLSYLQTPHRSLSKSLYLFLGQPKPAHLCVTIVDSLADSIPPTFFLRVTKGWTRDFSDSLSKTAPHRPGQSNSST